MTPEQNDRSLQPIQGAFADNTTSIPGELAPVPGDDAAQTPARSADDVHRAAEDEVAHKLPRVRRRRHTRWSARRLGRLECTLLGLIAIAIAITTTMAILAPSG